MIDFYILIIFCFIIHFFHTDYQYEFIEGAPSWSRLGDRNCLNMADAGLRQRLIPDSESPSDWDSDLPYGGKVYLARKKKPDPTYVKVIEASCISIHLLYPM